MKRPWKLSIEVGGQSGDQPKLEESSVSLQYPDTTSAWNLLVEARQRILDARSRPDETSSSVDAINNWIGGGLAVLGSIMSESPQTLLDRLIQEVPNKEQEGFFPVKRERPKPHPGAPKDLDISTLTDQEREELGIILPQVEESDPELDILDGVG